MKQRILRWLLKAFLQRYGYQLIREPGDGEYDEVFPIGRYAPWNLDCEFRRVYAAIRQHTLVDLYRCWELWSLVAQAQKLCDGAILEVGVWRGGTGALLAYRAKTLGMDAPVYLCDTFCGVVKAGDRDTLYRGGEHADASPKDVLSLLHSLACQATILQGIFPEGTARLIPTETRFRLVHIDVDVYRSARDVLDWVWPRLVAGGLVVFDDYGDVGTAGVRRLVNESVLARDRLYFHNLNGHAVLVKRGD